MGDARLSTFVRALVLDDIIPTLQPSPIDLAAYAQETFERFRNPVINHRLAQIAWDGSQKLPYRLLDTIIDARSSGRPVDRLAVPIAAWILFLERQARGGATIVDPLAEQLAAMACADDAVDRILAFRAMFPARLITDPVFHAAVAGAIENMQSNGVAAALAADLVTEAHR